MLQLSVSDTGRGFDVTVSGRLFEPFFTTRTEGTGLGLAIVRNVVEAHGGKVEARSVPGRGKRICAALAGRKNINENTAMKTLPILIVEDDRDLREALCDTLALSGYEAISAADGVMALEMLRRRTVGLVVTDVQMQPMDGHTLLAEIKQAYPHLPVLLMTAYGVIDKAVEAMRAGACHYLTKPFEPDALLAEVVRYMLPAPADGAVEVTCRRCAFARAVCFGATGGRNRGDRHDYG